ncbi:MAG: glycosyltransferase family 2 protein [Candidatus Saccharimonadales bacterium]
MNRVAIIILNWNGIGDTVACLDSLESQSYKTYSITVIDNGSVDNSVKILKKYIADHTNSRLNLICNKSNLGFAGGVNIGIRYALENNFDAIALLNNDATADKDWLAELVDVFDDKEVGISTCLLLHEDGKTIDSTGEQYSKWGLPFPRNRGVHHASANPSGLTFGATGGATLYRAEMFKDIGLFDEDFFAYYEDGDISFRAQLAGWKVRYSSKAIAYHKQGATSNKIPGFAVYQTFKNLQLLYIKNVPRGLLISIGTRLFFAYVLMYINTFTHGTGWSATKGVFQAFVLGFKKLFVERSIVQKKKQVSTGYIKSILWDDLPPDQTGIRKVRKIFTGK